MALLGSEWSAIFEQSLKPDGLLAQLTALFKVNIFVSKEDLTVTIQDGTERDRRATQKNIVFYLECLAANIEFVMQMPENQQNLQEPNARTISTGAMKKNKKKRPNSHSPRPNNKKKNKKKRFDNQNQNFQNFQNYHTGPDANSNDNANLGPIGGVPSSDPPPMFQNKKRKKKKKKAQYQNQFQNHSQNQNHNAQGEEEAFDFQVIQPNPLIPGNYLPNPVYLNDSPLHTNNLNFAPNPNFQNQFGMNGDGNGSGFQFRFFDQDPVRNREVNRDRYFREQGRRGNGRERQQNQRRDRNSDRDFDRNSDRGRDSGSSRNQSRSPSKRKYHHHTHNRSRSPPRGRSPRGGHGGQGQGPSTERSSLLRYYNSSY